MSIIITDSTAIRPITTRLTPADQVNLIQSREAAVLAHRQAQAHLTPEQLIQAGEEAEKLLFG